MSNLNEPTGRTSKSILLKTATPDFLEFVGNGKKYAIPPYQRDYSWGEEHWDDLWNDILALRDESESRHYMGALVVQAKTDRDFLVIDGQQRLATLSIVALVVIDKLKNLAESNVDSEKNLERSKGLRNRYIGEKDPASLIESSKLTMNATDDGFYQDYLVQLRRPQNPRGLPKSNRLMWDCFQWFSKRIDGMRWCRYSGRTQGLNCPITCTARRVGIATGIQSAIPLKSVQHKSQGNIDMHPTKNDLPIEKRAALALLLNASLADLIDLGLQAKQSHWNVKGPTFIALHELFDSIAEVVGEFVDDVAERIVALGGIAEGTIGIVSKRTKLASYPVNITSGKDHVEALSTALATVGKSVRSDIDKATDLGDADSADLLTGISRSIDKNLWFVEAHLQGDK